MRALLSSTSTPSPTLGRLGDEGFVHWERKLAVRDHAGQPVEHLDVDPLEHSRAPADRQSRLAGHDGHQLALPADRNAHQPGSLASTRDCDFALDDAPQAPCSGHDGPVGFVDDLADQVVEVKGLVRGRPDLAHDHERLR